MIGVIVILVIWIVSLFYIIEYYNESITENKDTPKHTNPTIPPAKKSSSVQ